MKLSELQRMKENIPEFSALSSAKQQELFTRMGLSPDNLYQELEMESRFVDTHKDVTPTFTPMQLHSHSFYELLYCCTSCGVEYLVGTRRYQLEKGDVIIVPPGVSHRPLLPENMTEPYKRYVLWVSEEFASLLSAMMKDAVPQMAALDTHLLRTSGTQQDIIHELFRSGVREAEKRQTNWEIAVIGNTIQLMVQLHRAVVERAAAPLKSVKPELLDQVLDYVERHLSEKILLADVARHFFVSESTITQTFRKKMGESFYHCVTQRRLIAAKALIGKGEPLESVSHRVGFSDYSTFYRAFRKEFGISPKQFRKMAGPGEA